MKIKKLHPEVQSFLRTGIAMTDVTQCAIELVQNSLDAKATSIAVRVDLENFTIQVVDNGRGLNREELGLIGTRQIYTEQILRAESDVQLDDISALTSLGSEQSVL